MHRALTSLSTLAFLAVGACALSPESATMTGASAGVVEKVVYVSAQTKPCTGVGKMTCLQVRDRDTGPWLNHYFGYQGFTHVPGIEYRLRVRGTPVENPPADGSSMQWSLIEILDQNPAKP